MNRIDIVLTAYQQGTITENAVNTLLRYSYSDRGILRALTADYITEGQALILLDADLQEGRKGIGMVNANMNEVRKYLSTLGDDEHEQVCMNALVYAMTDGYLAEAPANRIESIRDLMYLLDADNSEQLVEYVYDYLTDGCSDEFELWYDENILEDAESEQ